jgi:nucleoside-diphosphate-sugar epimerase
LGHDVVGLDVLDHFFTTQRGSITDRLWVRHCMLGMQVVFHAATLHKPHVGTHSRQDFIDVNVSGAAEVGRCFLRAWFLPQAQCGQVTSRRRLAVGMWERRRGSECAI